MTMFDLSDSTHDRMNKMYEALNSEEGLDGMKFEWCCKGRHGVVRNIPKNRGREISNFLAYFFGSGCDYFQAAKPGYQNAEFVHMTKVYPPPRKPWAWCGKTILFSTWKSDEEKIQQMKSTFRVGERVQFLHYNKTYTGLIAGIQKRATVIVEDGGKWYIPLCNLIRL
jgi:hypothetical protein